MTKLKKCGDCRMNKNLDTAAEHCTSQKQLRKKANEFRLEVLLESIMGKKHRIQSIADILHIDNLQMPIIKIATCEEELINMYLQESQVAKKLKIIAGRFKKLVIKKGTNGKKHDKKVQESMFGIMKQEKIWTRLEMIRGVISNERVRKVMDLTAKEKGAINITRDLVNLAQSRFIEHIWKFRYELTAEWEVKEGIAKDNKRKPQTAEEITDTKSSKKQKGKEKQITQLETNSVNSQSEQRTHKAKRRVNKENQDP
ncbi:44673_t:CDS:2 [Gigaspora margarita]|uniref:44673_t:CDS:1 n=1 Tax=Gigaspora margarita TaxID=4874 RepID=A0ABM8W1Z8_GIGMA|nr:44673_t:CDS:2 [Gigaspora margarita]